MTIALWYGAFQSHCRIRHKPNALQLQMSFQSQPCPGSIFATVETQFFLKSFSHALIRLTNDRYSGLKEHPMNKSAVLQNSELRFRISAFCDLTLQVRQSCIYLGTFNLAMVALLEI